MHKVHKVKPGNGLGSLVHPQPLPFTEQLCTKAYIALSHKSYTLSIYSKGNAKSFFLFGQSAQVLCRSKEEHLSKFMIATEGTYWTGMPNMSMESILVSSPPP